MSNPERIMMDDQGKPCYRTYQCWDCKVSWEAVMVLSSNTQNVSGERSEYCPKCSRKFCEATAAYVKD